MSQNELIEQATMARDQAYAPYSKFTVGAALRTKSGRIFTGCNVENVSLGLTICAERTAVVSAVAAGEREFVSVAVVTGFGEPVFPCGACRQVLAEFNPRLEVIASTTDGKTDTALLSDLLPHSNCKIRGG
jgi:cytidine deaminase